MMIAGYDPGIRLIAHHGNGNVPCLEVFVRVKVEDDGHHALYTDYC